jgi:hypothetical protein
VSEEVLLGYIGDVDGNDDNLVAMDAVAEEAGQYFRYPASGGNRIEVDASDLDYVHKCSPELARRWSVGDVIWFAGRHLVARSVTDVVLRPFAATWTLTAQGHRMRTGSAPELRRWRDHSAGQLSVCLCRYLMDSMEREVGQAERTLELYLAIENTAEPRRFLNTALFYHEQFDYESYQFERERAVRSGAFADADKFDTQFEEMLTFLRSDRLRDVNGQALHQKVLIPNGDTMRVMKALMLARGKLGSQFDFDDLHTHVWHDRVGAFASMMGNADVHDERA